jgi:hypothetical protein
MIPCAKIVEISDKRSLAVALPDRICVIADHPIGDQVFV